MARTNDNMLPSRERVAARRKNKAGQSARSQAVRQSGPYAQPKRAARVRAVPHEAATPGARHVAVSWFSSGRIASAVLLLGSLLAIIYIFTDSRFTVQNVQVVGAEVLSRDQIVNLADANGQKIWYVDSAQIIEHLKTSAYIEDASISVDLPDKLLINVVERRPELRWANGGQQYLVDGSGRVLGQAKASETLSNTLVIEDRSTRALKPNDTVSKDALGLARSLALRLPAEVGMRPLSINWNDDRGVFVLAPDNKTVIFGTSERLDEKLTVLDTLLKQGTVFTLLDLRPKTPYYRNETGG